MGLLNGNNDGESENILKKVAKTGKKVWSTIMSLMILMKFIPLILVGVIVGSLLATCFSFVIDVFASENTVENIYETLEIEDMTELVEIKENSNGEYYIDFKEDTDQKLEDMIEVINSKSGTHGVPTDKDFLKELIKAELVTKFPNLGGTIPEDSSGFQGAVNLRRISPNKEIGELTSKGKGETSNIEQEEAEDPNENVGDYEAVVKSWEEGQELYTNTNAAIYKQTESELNPGSDTGNWEFVYDDQTKEKIKIEKGTQVTYTGTYKNNTNETTKVTTTYVEVKTSDRTCFVKAQNLSTKAKTSTSSNQQIASQKYAKVTSRAKTKTMGNEQEEYTIALVPAYNGENGLESGDLKEKELTKKVADKVESLFQEYSNIKIVQTEGTNGIRNADPDMAIVIYFNYGQTGTETGVDTIYKESDEISHLFADILSKSISESMGLTNLYAGEDVEKCNGTSLISIENSLSTGFPSVITRGGYLNGKTEQQLLKADGTDRYAQGIVKGIEEYINANKEGYEATEVEKETVQNSIESKVIKMKYVPLETFKKYVEENNQEALKVFTMDEQFNLLTATWNWENGKTEISENSAMDFRTMLQQYHMPYEYLLFYYTDTDYEDFSLELAKKVQETEIVMAIQDNITTTKETKITQEQKVTDPKSYQEIYGESWHTTNTEETVMESVSTSIEITYVNTWCVKSYKESSYSEEILKMGDKDEIIINLKGTATSSSSSSCTSPKEIDSGTIKIPVENEVLAEDGTTQIETSYIYANYTVEEKTTTDIETYSHQYDSGESKTEGNENVFVELYQEHKMQNRVREEWLFKILENNEKTANMVDLTKYLMFKATSENYGKVEYDFSEFDISNFQGNSFYGDFIVKTDEANASPVATKEQLQAGLKKWVSGNQQSNALMVLDKVIECQEKYKLNAVFIYALLQQECGIGTADSSWVRENNWMSLTALGHIQYESPQANIDKGCNNIANGDYYFKVGKYSLYEIGEVYCADPPPPQWADEMKEKMLALYQACGITINTGYGLDAENQAKMDAMLAEAVEIANDDSYTYVYGASHNGPDGWNKNLTPKQFDCSSFVGYLYYKYFDVYVGGDTEEIKSKNQAKKVSLTDLQPGDILWRSGHVDIYLGNGKRVGAHSSSTGIYVDEYKSSYTCAFRIIAGTGGTVANGGEGTKGVYTAITNGRRFNLYLQGSGAPWSSKPYGESGSMSAAGCGPTAAAIIASGYDGSITPETFRKSIIDAHGGRIANYSTAAEMHNAFKRLGINVKTEVKSFSKQNIVNCLKNGGQVWVVVQNCKYTSGAHCMALIDYNASNDKVYVAHGTGKSKPDGWDSLDYIVENNKHDTILCVGG